MADRRDNRRHRANDRRGPGDSRRTARFATQPWAANCSAAGRACIPASSRSGNSIELATPLDWLTVTRDVAPPFASRLLAHSIARNGWRRSSRRRTRHPSPPMEGRSRLRPRPRQRPPCPRPSTARRPQASSESLRRRRRAWNTSDQVPSFPCSLARYAAFMSSCCDGLRSRPDEVAAASFPRTPLTVVPLAIALATILESAEAAILLAANIGGDSDSVASIAGAILGARYPETINDEWYAVVENQSPRSGLAGGKSGQASALIGLLTNGGSACNHDQAHRPHRHCKARAHLVATPLPSRGPEHRNRPVWEAGVYFCGRASGGTGLAGISTLHPARVSHSDCRPMPPVCLRT